MLEANAFSLNLFYSSTKRKKNSRSTKSSVHKKRSFFYFGLMHIYLAASLSGHMILPTKLLSFSVYYNEQRYAPDELQERVHRMPDQLAEKAIFGEIGDRQTKDRIYCLTRRAVVSLEPRYFRTLPGAFLAPRTNKKRIHRAY